MISNDGRCGGLQTIQQAHGAHKWAHAKEEKNFLRNTIHAQEQRQQIISEFLARGGKGKGVCRPSTQQQSHLSPMVLGGGGRLLVESVRMDDGELHPVASPVFGGSPNAQLIRMEQQLEEYQQRRRKDMTELYHIHKALGRPVESSFEEFCNKQDAINPHSVLKPLTAPSILLTSSTTPYPSKRPSSHQRRQQKRNALMLGKLNSNNEPVSAVVGGRRRGKSSSSSSPSALPNDNRGMRNGGGGGNIGTLPLPASPVRARPTRQHRHPPFATSSLDMPPPFITNTSPNRKAY